METQTFHPHNGDGWRLFVKRHVDPARFNPELRPLAIVPGYGMNSFIFGYHPRGVSMIDDLIGKGFEVWTMNFRGQDGTIPDGGSLKYGFSQIVNFDLPAAVGCIVENRGAKPDKLDIIGCSLGGTYLYAYLVLHRANPLGNVVAMGAPLRWEHVHPALKLAFAKPALLGRISLRGTRAIARCALPVAARIPGLLHIYLHPAIVDLSQPEELAKTVEDPNPRLNREIAEWVNRGDLIVDGVNICEGFVEVRNPLYLMLACADGIVPEASALSAARLAGSGVKDVITVGDAQTPMAHADMFISDPAAERVFAPLAAWLLDHQDPAEPKPVNRRKSKRRKP